jgi:polysaccharide export outer membrane protein
MKRLLLVVVAALMLLISGTALAAGEYIMSPGDKLMITVTGYEEYSSNPTQPESAYIVRPDGRISFPLVGTIDTTDKTVGQFTEELRTKLSEYLVNPDVSVNLIQWGTTRVFVLGEVTKAGLYELNKSHRVLDAIGAASGFTKDAAKKKVYLIRDGDEKKTTQLNFNDYLTKGDLKQNVVLHEGDCLYLTSNGRFNFNTDILPFISAWYMFDRIKNDK